MKVRVGERERQLRQGGSLTTLNRLHFPGCCSRQSRSSRRVAFHRPPSDRAPNTRAPRILPWGGNTRRVSRQKAS
ncbi:Hypothetical protein AA314_07119 [Archangium gephyra]|uniref:Uncharacterized protein n=1 Tax=Archangium gephyra TaxID=48 RepID=A0AAC8QD57_9BACT|nr:Hypothetical protein AA314_07119 [Archangium gephyra]